LESELSRVKGNGSYANTDFRVQELAEYTVEATNLNNAPAATDAASEGGMPWD
jgi:hypothetical protein